MMRDWTFWDENTSEGLSQRAQSGLRTTKVYAVDKKGNPWSHTILGEHTRRYVFIVQQGDDWFFVDADTGERLHDPNWPLERMISLDLEDDPDYRLVYPSWYEDLEWSCGL